MNDYVFHEEPETGAIVVNGIGRYKGWFYSAMRNTVLWTRPEDQADEMWMSLLDEDPYFGGV